MVYLSYAVFLLSESTLSRSIKNVSVISCNVSSEHGTYSFIDSISFQTGIVLLIQSMINTLSASISRTLIS